LCKPQPATKTISFLQKFKNTDNLLQAGVQNAAKTISFLQKFKKTDNLLHAGVQNAT